MTEPASSTRDGYAHDSALALLARQVSAAIEASHRELYAPESYSTHDARVAWADGYTQACADIRAAIKAVASDGT